ncbi:MAG TPA: M81 family metallopeptidase, partial [Verrucomicrobiales bacterium]|nr:M81 family metallopeptidase [Verrucomicrobiales bacterium]
GMNVVAGFSFADTADTGVSVSAIADPGATALAEAALESLTTLAWDLRAKGVSSILRSMRSFRD